MAAWGGPFFRGVPFGKFFVFEKPGGSRSGGSALSLAGALDVIG